MTEPRTHIYICDLANNLNEIDNKSIPIGAGFVASFAKKELGDGADIQVVRTLDQLTTLCDGAAPQVVGFSSFDWNHNLTLKAATYIKERFPQCWTVMGGANVEISPEDNKRMLETHPQFDFLVYGDGERPFLNILKLHERFGLAGLSKAKEVAIHGVRTLSGNRLVMGNPLDLMENLDDIPSPYLTGLFDELLTNEGLMPILQNVRGCPYKCRFCVSGSQSGNLRHFSFERITAEFEYLRAKSKNRFIRLSDDNFGIFEHDVDLAKYLRRMYDTHQYPAGLKAYSAKVQNDRTRRLTEILKPLMMMCISFQTTTKEVMKRTLRTSSTIPRAIESLDFARKREISTGTELIFGLPGETLASMKEVIDTTIGLKFDSISIGPLWLLKGSDLYTKEARKENGYRSLFMLAENAITDHEGIVSIETDEIAVESKYYTFEEWKQFLRYKILLNMTLTWGYGKELIYHAMNHGVTAMQLFDRILENPESYPQFSQAANGYLEKHLSLMFESEQEVRDYVMENMSQFRGNKVFLTGISRSRMNIPFMVDTFLRDKDQHFLKEFARCIESFGITEGTQEILDLALAVIIYPDREFVDHLTFRSGFHIPAWIQEGYNHPLSHYRLESPRDFILKSHSPVAVRTAIHQDRDEGETNFFNFYRHLNSGLVRRFASMDTQETNSDPSSPWVWEVPERELGGHHQKRT